MRAPAPIVRCALAALLLTACAAPAQDDPAASTPAAADDSPTTAATGLAYPALYQELELPELPGGTVTTAGRQAVSLSDGLSIQVVTSMTVDAAREFYDTTLAGQGWNIAPSRAMPGMPVSGLQATRDGLRYTAMITAMPDGGTQVAITVLGP